MPVLAPKHDDAVAHGVILLRKLFQHLFQNAVFRRLPLPVLLAKLLGKRLRLRSVIRQKQACRRQRTADPAGRVDARRQNKADGVGGERFAAHTRAFHQRAKARILRTLQTGQTVCHDHTVLVAQRHHIRHCAHRHQGKILLDHLLQPVGARKRADKLKRDPDARQFAKRIAAFGTPGI